MGEQEEIGRERKSFEIIENVLGNNAPRIIDFADSKGKGIIKYRYASMGAGQASSFQKKFTGKEPVEKIQHYLHVVFKEQLGKLYTAKTHEKMNLLSYYEFDNISAGKLKASIGNVYQGNIEANEFILHANSFPNPLNFYKNDLDTYLKNNNMYAFQSYVHGDLNGANIIIDAQDNVWIIDFFHTHRGHVLKDLVKLENDLLYIFSEMHSESDFQEALKISEVLFAVSDLQASLPDITQTGITKPSFVRVYKTLSYLRSLYSDLVEWDRNPLQVFIAQLRYSMHSLIFDECNQWQKEWALYNSGKFSQIISNKFLETDKLRIDFIKSDKIDAHSLALTILPGRKDYSRDLSEDLKEIKEQQIDCVVSLITKDEMDMYGVPELLDVYKKQGVECLHVPVIDQKIPVKAEIERINAFINAQQKKHKKVLIHCVGGLGRSGLVAACYLKSLGYPSDDAIKIVREARSSRAIESTEQEKFVYDYNERTV
ncbi:dual specificity protein phosphatase family protein [Cytophaga hutchinsonii]